MTKLSPRRALLITALLLPAIAVVLAVALEQWALAAAFATALLTAVGILSLVALSEVRAIKRRSEQQSRKIRHITKTTSHLRLQQQQLLRGTRAVRNNLAPLQLDAKKLARSTNATLTRTEHAERRLVGIVESLRLETSTLLDAAPKIHTIRDEVKTFHKTLSALTSKMHVLRDDLRAVQRDLSDQAKNAANSSVRRTVAQLTAVARDETRQVEALLQLLPRIDPVAPLPPSGRWAMDARALLHLHHLCKTLDPRNVVELGGGTSTVWLAYLLRSAGKSITSFDHDATFARLTQDSLERHGLSDEVSVRTAPLKPIQLGAETFTWYQLDVFDGLRDIDLLIVDGPPASNGPLVRYAALPALHDRLAPDCTVVIDDSERPDETTTLERWLEEFSGFTRVDEGVSRLAVLSRTK